MKRINVLFAVIGLVFVLFFVGIGFAIGRNNAGATVQAQAQPTAIPTTIDEPATFERPALQAESSAPTTIDVPAVYLGEMRAQALTPEEEMQILINQERANKGLSALAINTHLTQAALIHSQDQADHNFCGHQGSNGDSAWQRIPAAGYQGSLGGETVACGQQSVNQTFNDWKNSPGHYAILMGQYGEFGLGWANKPGTTYINFWTATFGGSPGKTTPGGGNPGPLPPTPTPFIYQPIPTQPPVYPTRPPVFQWTPTPRPVYPTPVPYWTPTPRPQQPTPIPQPSGQGWRIISDCDQSMRQCSTTVYPR